MKILYVSNYLNHHQAPIADEMNKIQGVEYIFAEMSETPESFKKAGYPDFSDRTYLLRGWENDANYQKVCELVISSDVVMFGGCYFDLMKLRLRQKSGLTFQVGERWLKRGLLNLFSPRLIRFVWLYHTKFHRASNYYNLCASAYSPGDNRLLGVFNNRSYKWGYFTKIDTDLEAYDRVFSEHRRFSILWCARFLFWKHPELPVKLAYRLKKKGYDFLIDMYGAGPEFEQTKKLVNKLSVSDFVIFHGNVPNAKLLEQMRKHSIFLFTSDRHEGWGAVANEAMSSGCVVVASDSIGCVPFLIQDNKNGCVFKTEDLDSLENKVEYLLTHSDELKSYSEKAYSTMRDIWSPQNAAKNLIKLIDDLSKGNDTSVKEGPCSKALPLS